MFSKASGENVTFSDERYMQYPHRVVVLYRMIADTIHKKRKREIDQMKNGTKNG
jgi:hypothetical protein